jgi:glutamate formiminotransferase/glutamate formiminotransferase/formiminotetrahydrofolate cyclodeaminase
LLLAVPNVSEGRDRESIEAIRRAFAEPHAAASSGPGAPRLLDTHSDPDHNRSVFTLAGPPGGIASALLRGARAALERIDVMTEPFDGQHPHVGALDVAPIVFADPTSRGAACAEALVLADRIGAEREVPVFLYGDLAGGRTRAELRRGGVRVLAERMAAADRAREIGAGGSQEVLRPDFGPARLHPSAGATLVAAREPLIAFNLILAAPAAVGDARRIASLIREGGAEGLPGLRAIGVTVRGAAQLSMNVERPLELPLAEVVEAVAGHAEVASAEIVGLAPSVALEGFPKRVPLAGFDPDRQLLEKALRS